MALGCLLAGALCALPANAQKAVDLQWGMAIQPRFSYGLDAGDDTESAGFGIRRARLRTVMTYEQKAGLHFDADFAGGTAGVVDLFAFYRMSPNVRLRLGYLAGPQPRAYIPTGFPFIDGIDRAAIAERWAQSTIGGSGRDFGMEVQYDDRRTRLAAFVHNGDGNIARANLRRGIAGLSATGGATTRGIAVSGSASHAIQGLAGLEVGGFAGYNASRNPNTAATSGDPGRDYATYSAHVYWGAIPGSQPVRMKAEILGIQYAAAGGAPSQQALGVAFTGAARLVEGSELVASYEQYAGDTDADSDRYVLAGITFSPSARRGLAYGQERFTLAYLYGAPAGVSASAQHMVVLQFQFALW
ncbi:MAG: hypothetical protein R2834_09380 [Rhodothermales bacterium]